MNIIFSSYGNDSCALIQWASEADLQNVIVLYSDTGWAKDKWNDRVTQMESWASSLGFECVRTESMGFKALVRKRKAFPRQGMQFCTTVLKMMPAQEWMDARDPEKKAICIVGVRRAESANRSKFPERIEDSPNHGGRTLWAPLVMHSDADRDALLARAGIPVLPHRSMECFPCINSNRIDLVELAKDPKRVEEIARFEEEMGVTSKGNKRTMFRPYRHRGASGIHEVVRWAVMGRRYSAGTGDLFDPDDGTGDGCDAGWCGS